MSSYCHACGWWRVLDPYTFECADCTAAWYAAHARRAAWEPVIVRPVAEESP